MQKLRTLVLRICLLIPALALTTLYAQSSKEFFLPKQGWKDFTGEERVFFYRIALTTDILQNGVFQLFEFTDSICLGRINDTLPDYDFIENRIVANPEKLLFHSSEVPRISNGLIADLALQYALWDMNRVLHFRNSTDPLDADIQGKLRLFNVYLNEIIPASVINGNVDLWNQLPQYFSPSLNCTDRIAAIRDSGFIQADQALCVNAIYFAMEKYVAMRTAEIFRALGGNVRVPQKSYLSAVGDGANYSDLEEGYEPTTQTSALPENKGLFRFFINEETIAPSVVNENPSGEKMLLVEDVVIREFKTNSEKATVLHFDVHNWHKQRQTTVVVQKGGKSYILYGNNENRLLSPDSIFGEGTTYRRLIWELEKIYITEVRLKLDDKQKAEMEEAYLLLAAYESKLDQMQKNLGLLEMEHKKTGDYYVFGDGASFNRRTQDFTFAQQSDVESFQVIHLGFGEKVFSETKEESFVHIHESTVAKDEKYALHKVLRGRKDPKMTPGDSLQILEVYRALCDEDAEVKLFIHAGGTLGEDANGSFFRNETLSPVRYSEEAVRAESATVIHAIYGANLRIDVSVWLDQMLPKDFAAQYPKFAKWKTKNPSLNEIDYLCGLRALEAFNQLVKEMKETCPKWIKDTEEQKRILNKLSELQPGAVYFADGKIQTNVF